MSNQVLYRQKYNGRRRTLAAEDRENRFIVDYLQHKHPNIYGELKKKYTELKARYPDKNDIRKTKEYEEIITGAPTKKYKYTRHLTIRDNMVLNIELSNTVGNISPYATVAPPVDATVVQSDDVPVDATVAPPVDATVVQSDDVPVDATVAPPVDATVVQSDDVPVDATVAQPDDTVAPPVDATVVQSDDVLVDTTIVHLPDLTLPLPDLTLPLPDLTLPYMSDETIGQIIQDLRQDPTMSCIMDELNDEFDDIFW